MSEVDLKSKVGCFCPSRLKSYWVQVVDLKSTWGHFCTKWGRIGRLKQFPGLLSVCFSLSVCISLVLCISPCVSQSLAFSVYFCVCLSVFLPVSLCSLFSVHRPVLSKPYPVIPPLCFLVLPYVSPSLIISLRLRPSYPLLPSFRPSIVSSNHDFSVHPYSHPFALLRSFFRLLVISFITSIALLRPLGAVHKVRHA